MTSKIYINDAKNSNGISHDIDLISAVKDIIIDSHVSAQQYKLKLVDTDEWEAIITSLQPHIDADTGISVNLGSTSIYVTDAEIKAAYGIAKQMYETQQKSESSYQQAVESVLPNVGITLGEKIRQDFPHDAVAQSLVLECIKSQADSLQQCEANAQASMQQ